LVQPRNTRAGRRVWACNAAIIGALPAKARWLSTPMQRTAQGLLGRCCSLPSNSKQLRCTDGGPCTVAGKGGPNETVSPSNTRPLFRRRAVPAQGESCCALCHGWHVKWRLAEGMGGLQSPNGVNHSSNTAAGSRDSIRARHPVLLKKRGRGRADELRANHSGRGPAWPCLGVGRFDQ
jgi:hypothetical protein